MDNLPEPEGSGADLQLHKTRAYSLLLNEQVVLKCNRVSSSMIFPEQVPYRLYPFL